MKIYLDNNVVSAIAKGDTPTEIHALNQLLDAYDQRNVRGGSGWLDSFTHSLSGASRVVDYAAVCCVVRFS